MKITLKMLSNDIKDVLFFQNHCLIPIIEFWGRGLTWVVGPIRVLPACNLLAFSYVKIWPKNDTMMTEMQGRVMIQVMTASAVENLIQFKRADAGALT